MKFITAALLALSLVLVPPASAAECVNQTQEQAYKEFSEIDGATIVKLTDDQISKLIDAVGNPPNAVEGPDRLEMALVYRNDVSAVLVFQAGCYIANFGPAPKFYMLRVLELDNATLAQ